MPWYGFIHPLLAVFTLVYGIVTIQTNMSRILDWNFPLRRQRVRGVVFFLLTVANLILGFVISAALRGQGLKFRLIAHVPLAFAVVVLALGASLTMFARPRKPGDIPGLMRINPWLGFIALALTLTMGFTALLVVFGI